MGGMDCSNFTAFVYNYALGIRFTSRVDRQAEEVGRKLPKSEPLVPGDLIYIYADDMKKISHVAIYISPTEIIDSIDSGIRIRAFNGWYKSHYAWARRVVE
jgi:cell wall-associated NlpC family hydrolase